MYDTALRLIHSAGMLCWLLSAIGVLFMRSNKESARIITDKIKMPMAFFVPLTGCLLLIERPHLFTEWWMISKIVLSVTASGFAIASRLLLLSETSEIENAFFRYLGLEIILLLSVIMAVCFHG